MAEKGYSISCDYLRILDFVRMKSNWKSSSRQWNRINYDFLIREHLLPPELGHHIMHESQYFQSGIFHPGAHPRSSSKPNKRIRQQSIAFVSRRVKPLRIREVFRVLVCGVGIPMYLNLEKRKKKQSKLGVLH